MTTIKKIIIALPLLFILARVSVAESPATISGLCEPKEITQEITPKEWIVFFADIYGADSEELIKVAQCESRLGEDLIGDNGNALGLFQYWQSTWDHFSELRGEEMNINSTYDQAKLTAWIFANYPQYKSHWTCWKALDNGGEYSFYSNKLKRHFTVTCK